ncbi:MAG: hypothetical protein RR389_07090, partial [Christensenella sp.]
LTLGLVKITALCINNFFFHLLLKKHGLLSEDHVFFGLYVKCWGETEKSVMQVNREKRSLDKFRVFQRIYI